MGFNQWQPVLIWFPIYACTIGGPLQRSDEIGPG